MEYDKNEFLRTIVLCTSVNGINDSFFALGFALHRLATKSKDVVEWFLNQIPEDQIRTAIDSTNPEKETALCIACNSGNWYYAKRLIEYGANINHRYVAKEDLCTPLGNALKFLTRCHCPELGLYNTNSPEDNIILFMLRHKADWNAELSSISKLHTPFWIAVDTNSYFIVKMMLDFGCEIGKLRADYTYPYNNIIITSLYRSSNNDITKLLISRTNYEDRKKIFTFHMLLSVLRLRDIDKIRITLAFFLEFGYNLTRQECFVIGQQLSNFGYEDMCIVRLFLLLFPNLDRHEISSMRNGIFRAEEDEGVTDLIGNFELSLFDLLHTYLSFQDIREEILSTSEGFLNTR